MKAWLAKRLEAIMDGVLGGLALIGTLAAAAVIGGAIAVFGGRSIAVEGWEVILLLAVLVSLILGEVLLLRRTIRPGVAPTPEPGPHADLLHRLGSLQTDLKDGPEYINWHVARVYNQLLQDARRECPTVDFTGMQEIENGPGNTGYAMIDRSSLRALARQLRSLVESDDPSWRRTDATLSM